MERGLRQSGGHIAAKFFTRMGQSARSAKIDEPIADVLGARASRRRPIRTTRSNFDFGSITSARSLSISASHERFTLGSNNSPARRSL